MLKRFGFKTKLVLLCLFMSVISLLISGVGIYGLKAVGISYNRIADDSLPRTRLSGDMLSSYRKVRIHLRTLGIPDLTKVETDEAVQRTLQAIATYETVAKEYSEFQPLPGEAELYEDVHQQWKEFKATGEHVLKLHASGSPEDLQEMRRIFRVDCPKAANAYSIAIEKLVAFHRVNAAKYVTESKSLANRINLFAISITILGVLIGMAVGIILASRLTQTVATIVNELNESSHQVASASQQIADTSQELSQTTGEQAASLEETATSLEEISSMVAMTSQNAKSTALSSNESRERAQSGKQVVDQMIQSMDEINQSNTQIINQVGRTNEQMGEIVRIIQEIGNRTKVINDIVFQTKILSFNASVEAARAGEHGKGFAIVAEEVGNLATMSGSAAKEIVDMLESSIQKVEGIIRESKSNVEVMVSEGKLKVATGTQVARQCGEVLERIVENVLHVTQMAGEISTASHEQSQGVGELTKAMTQLGNVTQQNAANSEQAAAAARQLSDQAEKLQNAIESLGKTIMGGDNCPQESQYADSAHLSQPAQSIGFQKLIPFVRHSEKNNLKAAVGDSTIPSRNHPGFNDM